MGKKTPPNSQPERKPFKMVRIRNSLATVAERRAEELAQDFTQYVNDAVRLRLEAEGLWPPKPKAPS